MICHLRTQLNVFIIIIYLYICNMFSTIQAHHKILDTYSQQTFIN